MGGFRPFRARRGTRPSPRGGRADMEIGLYTLNALLCCYLVYWCLRNADRQPGTRVSGLFRYREAPGETPPAPKPAGRPAPPGAWPPTTDLPSRWPGMR
jgi:hypothetical protein